LQREGQVYQANNIIVIIDNKFPLPVLTSLSLLCAQINQESSIEMDKISVKILSITVTPLKPYSFCLSGDGEFLIGWNLPSSSIFIG